LPRKSARQYLPETGPSGASEGHPPRERGENHQVTYAQLTAEHRKSVRDQAPFASATDRDKAEVKSAATFSANASEDRIPEIRSNQANQTLSKSIREQCHNTPNYRTLIERLTGEGSSYNDGDHDPAGLDYTAHQPDILS